MQTLNSKPSSGAPQGVYAGDYTPIAGINNAGTGQLPGGYSYNQPKLSASQLAAAQATAAANAQAGHSLANDVTQVVGSKVTQSDAAAVQSSLGQQVWTALTFGLFYWEPAVCWELPAHGLPHTVSYTGRGASCVLPSKSVVARATTCGVQHKPGLDLTQHIHLHVQVVRHDAPACPLALRISLYLLVGRKASL